AKPAQPSQPAAPPPPPAAAPAASSAAAAQPAAPAPAPASNPAPAARAPSPSVFAVTPSPQPKTAPKAKHQSVRFRGASPRKHLPEVRGTADFHKLPPSSASRPGRSDVSALDGGQAPRRHAARAVAPVSLDSRRHGSSSPLLFALLLAGAAL